MTYVLRPSTARQNGHGRKLGPKIVAGAAFIFTLSASSGAIAACTGTGGAAFAGGFVLPFAAGGSVNTLISAVNTLNTAFPIPPASLAGSPMSPTADQEGGGVWVRGIGGQTTTKTTTTTSGITVTGAPATGEINCATESQLSFSGVQIGTDTARLNWNGWNIHIGSTIGYMGAKSKDRSAPGALNPLGGTYEDSLQVPFASVYAAATHGGFFVDGQFRLDYYQNRLSDPLVGGMFNQQLDARGYSISANVGYHHKLQNNWFIEPSAGLVVSRVSVDPLSIAGTAILPVPGGTTLPGELRVHDLRSTLGRVSLRTGTTIVSDNVVWQPFATASVYHEFEGGARADFASVLGGTDIRGRIDTSSIGTYGQFGLGVAAQMMNTGWLGYIRADYRTGEHLHGYSVNGGLRYQFNPEQLASLSPIYTKAGKAPALAAAQPYNWSGFFVGASTGVLNGKTEWDTGVPGGGVSPRYAGFAYGGQIGYDWQYGNYILGVEGSIYGSNANGGRGCPPGGNAMLYTCEAKMDWLGTATARLGYSFWGRSIAYVRAGVAFGNTKLTTRCNTGPYDQVDYLGTTVPLSGCGASDSGSAVGWTIGYGTEFALSENWSVRAESNYFDLGTKRFSFDQGAGIPALNVDVRNRGFISTVGLNYRFSPEPVAAFRY